MFIVGPSAGMTDDNKHDATALARDAEDAGMRVRKVFHPNATWENVLDAIQGASLVVYMGHGNGWPSPHGPFQEDTKDGFGLNPSEGDSAYSTNYYGADKIRKRVRLAPNAVVLLGHLCYASGNGEEYMGPEHDRDIATKRADNYASGFLDVGARAVFAYGMDQKLDFPRRPHARRPDHGRDLRGAQLRRPLRRLHRHPRLLPRVEAHRLGTAPHGPPPTRRATTAP